MRCPLGICDTRRCPTCRGYLQHTVRDRGKLHTPRFEVLLICNHCNAMFPAAEAATATPEELAKDAAWDRVREYSERYRPWVQL